MTNLLTYNTNSVRTLARKLIYSLSGGELADLAEEQLISQMTQDKTTYEHYMNIHMGQTHITN
jgi:hypothetical protein